MCLTGIGQPTWTHGAPWGAADAAFPLVVFLCLEVMLSASAGARPGLSYHHSIQPSTMKELPAPMETLIASAFLLQGHSSLVENQVNWHTGE